MTAAGDQPGMSAKVKVNGLFGLVPPTAGDQPAGGTEAEAQLRPLRRL